MHDVLAHVTRDTVSLCRNQARENSMMCRYLFVAACLCAIPNSAKGRLCAEVTPVVSMPCGLENARLRQSGYTSL